MKMKQLDRLKAIDQKVKATGLIYQGTAFQPEYDHVGVIKKAMQWSMDGNVFNHPCTTVIHSEEFFHQLCAVADSTTNASEQELEATASRKWVFEQGGYQDLTAYLLSITEYGYKDTCVHEVLSPEWVTRMQADLPQIASIGDPILRTACGTYASWEPNRPSSGGILYFGDRRETWYRVSCVTRAMTDWENPDPIVGGTRFKDSKLRDIFMDNLSNYYREARCYHRLFTTWGKFPSDKHYSDEQVEDMIALSAAQANYNIGCYAGDYKAMDQHFNWYEVCCSTQVLCWMAGCPEYADEVLSHFKPIWDGMSLVIGDGVYKFSVEHMLFSGLYPTHDLESPLNYRILVEVCSILKLTVDHFWGNPNWQVRIMVCGDDSIVLFNWNLIHVDDHTAFYKKFARIHAAVSKRYGQIMEASKVEFSDEFAPFCKSRYYFKHVRGVTSSNRTINGVAIPTRKYSVKKALNSLYHPEHMPRFESDWGWLVWLSTILDCAKGMTKWNDVIDAIARSIATDDRAVSKVTKPSGDAALDDAAIMADWWFRSAFGRTWEGAKDFLAKSESYQRLYRLVMQYAS